VAEGFTQYYGQLLLGRAGYSDEKRTVAGLGRLADAVINGSGRQFRSPVEMSHMAPFVDAARSIDPTNFSTTFISYYTYGGAVALGLDLSLRDKTNGTVTLDDFMRSMWQTFGKPGGPAPGLVGRPYALTDLRDRLAEVSGDRAFADNFYTHYMIGRDVVDYVKLFARAGVVLRTRNAGRPWAGLPFSRDGSSRVGDLVAPGTPAYDAGLDADDVITAVEGTPVTTFAQVQDAINAHKPGDTLTVEFKRRTGATVTAKMTLKEDPSLEAVMIEDTGGTPTAEQKAFRESWLGPHSKQ
jgi:predicted metalloprotease with PDZ domain